MLIVIVLVTGGVVLLFELGVGPFPDPEGCRADVDGVEVDISTTQAENASLIAAIAVRRGLPARAASIALATAFQESKLHNLDYGDADSVGLFQQRPSQGWGTRSQLLDPVYATNAFYDALQKVDGYQDMRITEAAQRVQRSGFPEAYEAHAEDARALASALTGYSPGGRFSCVVHADPSHHGTAGKVTRAVTRAYGGLPVHRTGVRQDLTVAVGRSAAGNRLGWSVAQFLVAQAHRLHVTAVSFDGKRWTVGSASSKGWVRSGQTPRTRINVSLG